MNSISNKLQLDALEIYKGRLNAYLRKSPEEVVLFSHFGNIDASKVNTLINLVEQSLLENGVKRKIMKRICTVLIENLQNISIHGAMDKKGNQNAIVILSKGNDEIFITCGP